MEENSSESSKGPMRPGEDKLDELQVVGTWAGWNMTCQIAELKQMLRKQSWLTGQALASGFKTEKLELPYRNLRLQSLYHR